jgi:hypothetical protein
MVCSAGAIMGSSGFGSARSKLYRTVYMTVKGESEWDCAAVSCGSTS